VTTLSNRRSLSTISCNKSRTSVVPENQHSAVDMARASGVDVTVIRVSYVYNVCFFYPCFELCIQHGLLSKTQLIRKWSRTRQINRWLIRRNKRRCIFERFPIFKEVVLFDTSHQYHVSNVSLCVIINQPTNIMALCIKITLPSPFHFLLLLVSHWAYYYTVGHKKTPTFFCA